MKIMVIAPVSLTPEEIEMRQRNLEALCSPSTSIKVVPVEGLESVTDASSIAFLEPGVVRRVQEAERDGFDAAIIHCFSDAGLEAARTLVDIPVVGPVETILHVGCLIADRFGIVTLDDNLIPPLRRLIDKYGMASRVVSMKADSIPILEFRQRTAELEAKFLELSARAIEEGAELIIPGCLAILPALGSGSAMRLAEKLGVPVLDSSGIVLRIGELLVNMKLAHSKRAFPKGALAKSKLRCNY